TWIVEQSDTKVVMCGQRLGSDKVHKSTWTIDRAHKLSLTSKPNWKSQPGTMLVARATSEVCRLTAADVLLGLAYSAEELADSDGTEAPQDAPRRRTAKRKPVEPPAAEVEPDLEPPADAPEPEVEELPEPPGWEQ